jgi:5'-deoxynucleotidase YfbR-like HD superfamily hydrolase
MLLDFSFDQVMKMSNLKRWGIIEMSRDQSVAEHSYNVAIISGYLARAIDRNSEDYRYIEEDCVKWALCHDLTELLTGDIPTPMKTFLNGAILDMEKVQCPEYTHMKNSFDAAVMEVVKTADYIEAIQYALKFCVDREKGAILLEMRLKMDAHIRTCTFNEILTQSVKAIWLS